MFASLEGLQTLNPKPQTLNSKPLNGAFVHLGFAVTVCHKAQQNTVAVTAAASGSRLAALKADEGPLRRGPFNFASFILLTKCKGLGFVV